MRAYILRTDDTVGDVKLTNIICNSQKAIIDEAEHAYIERETMPTLQEDSKWLEQLCGLRKMYSKN